MSLIEGKGMNRHKFRDARVEILETRRLFVNYGLDLSFGSGGAVKAEAFLLAKPLVGGNILAVSDVGLARVTDAGKIDSTFGDSGIVSYPASVGSIQQATAFGQRLLVAGQGQTSEQLDVLEYNLDGTLVSGFGANGVANTTIGSPVAGHDVFDITAVALSASADGSAFVLIDVGIFNPKTQTDFQNRIQVRKIGSDGTFDSSFAGQGFIPIDGGDSSLVALSNGKLAVYSSTDDISSVVTFYNADGTIDPSMGTAGVTNLNSLAIDDAGQGPHLIEQADHRILLTGDDLVDINNSHPRVARLNANGSLDTTFGTSGIVTLPNTSGFNIAAASIALDSQQRILVADSADDLFRLTSTGALDQTLDNDGAARLEQGVPLFGTVSLGIQTIAADSWDRILLGNFEGLLRVAPRVPVALSHNTVFIDGTSGDDTIKVKVVGSNLQVILNGSTSTFPLASVDGVNITTEPGNNVVNVSVDLNSTITGDTGDDTITTAGGNDSIDSGDGNDSIASGAGNDTINAGAGDDFVDAGTSGGFPADDISGGDGNDTLQSESTDAVINGGAGNDSVHTVGDSSIDLGEGNNVLVIDEGTNRVNAGDGNNQIHIGGTGDNDVSVGAGNCTIVTGDGDDAIGAHGTDDITTNGGNDYIFHVPSDDTRLLTADAGAGDDTILGGDAPASLMGGDGNDFIRTGLANDTIAGGAGKDLIHSGPGSDLISGGGGRDHIFGQEGKDRIYGGNGNDILDGGAGDDRINGQSGNDTIFAEGGKDTLDGGAGLDSMDGGAKADLFNNADGEVDTIDGGTGTDSTQADNSIDQLVNVEVII
jgi:uncharacterized delta-60 repeat protein